MGFHSDVIYLDAAKSGDLPALRKLIENGDIGTIFCLKKALYIFTLDVGRKLSTGDRTVHSLLQETREDLQSLLSVIYAAPC